MLHITTVRGQECWSHKYRHARTTRSQKKTAFWSLWREPGLRNNLFGDFNSESHKRGPSVLVLFLATHHVELDVTTLGRRLSMCSSLRTHQPAGPRPPTGDGLGSFLWPRSFCNPITHYYSRDFKSETNKVGNIKELVQFSGLFTGAEIQMQAVCLKTLWTRLPHWALPVWWEGNNNNNNNPGIICPAPVGTMPHDWALTFGTSLAEGRGWFTSASRLPAQFPLWPQDEWEGWWVRVKRVAGLRQ